MAKNANYTNSYLQKCSFCYHVFDHKFHKLRKFHKLIYPNLKINGSFTAIRVKNPVLLPILR